VRLPSPPPRGAHRSAATKATRCNSPQAIGGVAANVRPQLGARAPLPRARPWRKQHLAHPASSGAALGRARSHYRTTFDIPGRGERHPRPAPLASSGGPRSATPTLFAGSGGSCASTPCTIVARESEPWPSPHPSHVERYLRK
jgi:hypothetical protein